MMEHYKNKKECNVCVLEENNVESSRIMKEFDSIAIAVNLYYRDRLDFAIEYLRNIPQEIALYIITSNLDILIITQESLAKRKNTKFILKENRGRDISALLVVFREFALQYKYIAFLHDKKPKNKFLVNDIELWNRNLWGNMLQSKPYICNIIQMLINDAELGLLVPPEPMGEYLNAWYKNSWEADYEITLQLAQELKLNCSIEREKSPITLGTTFWAKTDSLRKLLEKRWSYLDFPEEPMPDDGAINHAVERILSYVALDAGYKTCTVMTISYAEELLGMTKKFMKKAFQSIEEDYRISSFHQLCCLRQQKTDIIEFCKKHEIFYLYGCGKFGVDFLDRVRLYGFEPKGFVVSDGYKKDGKVKGLKVIQLNEIRKDQRIGVIICVNYDLQEKIEEILVNAGITEFIRGYI